MSFYLATFTTRNIVKITGLTMRQVDYWDRTHLIKPSIREASGHGTSRLYSFGDLVQLKVTKTLLDKGITLRKIRESVNYLKKDFPNIRRPLAEMKFLSDGETIFVLTQNKKVMLDTLSKGQLVFSLAIGEIIEDLKGDVVKIERDRTYRVSVKSKTYRVTLIHSSDKIFMVRCSVFPDCNVRAVSLEEALMKIKDMIGERLRRMGENKKGKKLLQEPGSKKKGRMV